MDSLKIGVFVGRLWKQSSNRRLALALGKLAPSDAAFEHIRIDDLPLYDQDFCPTLGQPEVFIHFKDDLISPDGKIGNPGTQKFLQQFVDRFIGWFKSHRR